MPSSAHAIDLTYKNFQEFELQLKRTLKLKKQFLNEIEKKSTSDKQKILFYQLGDQLFQLSKEFKKLQENQQAQHLMTVCDLYDEFFNNHLFKNFIQSNRLNQPEIMAEQNFLKILSSMRSIVEKSFIKSKPANNSEYKISEPKNKHFHHDEKHNDFWLHIAHLKISKETDLNTDSYKMNLRNDLSAYCQKNKNLKKPIDFAKKLYTASIFDQTDIKFTYSEIMVMLNEPNLRQIVYNNRFGLPKCFVASAINTHTTRKQELISLLNEYKQKRSASLLNRHALWSEFNKTDKVNAAIYLSRWLENHENSIPYEALGALKDRTLWKIISKFPDILPYDLNPENPYFRHHKK